MEIHLKLIASKEYITLHEATCLILDPSLDPDDVVISVFKFDGIKSSNPRYKNQPAGYGRLNKLLNNDTKLHWNKKELPGQDWEKKIGLALFYKFEIKQTAIKQWLKQQDLKSTYFDQYVYESQLNLTNVGNGVEGEGVCAEKNERTHTTWFRKIWVKEGRQTGRHFFTSLKKYVGQGDSPILEWFIMSPKGAGVKLRTETKVIHYTKIQIGKLASNFKNEEKKTCQEKNNQQIG